jgi:hypothetical protein
MPRGHEVIDQDEPKEPRPFACNEPRGCGLTDCVRCWPVLDDEETEYRQRRTEMAGTTPTTKLDVMEAIEWAATEHMGVAGRAMLLEAITATVANGDAATETRQAAEDLRRHLAERFTALNMRKGPAR